MDYTKFAKEQFEKCGIDTDAARMLADLLQWEVGHEIHNALLHALEAIADRLNAEGHNLTPYEIKQGELSYRDLSPEGDVQLRLACDVIISSGYAHMSTGRHESSIGRSRETR